MPISETRYVDITSAVGANDNIPTRNLGANFITENPLVPTGGHVDFSSADDVLAYFGSGSAEYARAAFYFGWISKVATAPQLIRYTRWANIAVAPQIFGATGPQSVASYTGISAGAFVLTLGGVTNTINGLNFTGATTLAGIAAIIQTAIRAKTGSLWTAATVTYDPTRQSFDLTGGATGAADIFVAAGSGGSDVAAQLGWLSATAILSDGADAQTITDVLADSSNQDNNFGSFGFIPTLDEPSILEAATWNNTQNVVYMYSVPVTSSNAVALQDVLIGLAGNTPTLTDPTNFPNEFDEMIPMMVLAATDYTRPNAVQNYMFQRDFNLTPKVNTDQDANTYDALRVNYYGQTQTAGVLRQFYQRGYMNGPSNAPQDQNTYANEMWFKDAMSAGILSLLLDVSEVPANLTGRSMLLTTAQATIDQAIFNGTISVGKSLTVQQQLFITQITNDPRAWKQVQNNGYWFDIEIVAYTNTNNGLTEYKAVYTLVYGKSDAIRFVQGSDDLI